MSTPMPQFVLSNKASTFQFSAKSKQITLPSKIQNMSESEQELIKKLSLEARDRYISKVVNLTSNSVGKKMCAIQIRNEAISEAVDKMNEYSPDFEEAYKKFQKICTSTVQPVVLKKPKVKSTTFLDTIEAEK